ncbi:MAG TPA: helix-turn-helix domain-containing protein [Baekduia sp.]|nr:helix-turn-helix domain-containing protein [Baekduia sp.]
MASTRGYAGIPAADRRAERRRRLMDAGYTLLAERGPDALTVTAVCQGARLTARYFYEHFENREALVAAIVRTEADAVCGAILAAALEAEGGPEERARVAVAAMLDQIEADPRRGWMARRHDEVVLRLRALVAERMTELMVEHGHVIWPQAAEHAARMPLAAALTVGGVLQVVADFAEGGSDLARDDVVRIGARFALQTGEIVLAG